MKDRSKPDKSEESLIDSILDKIKGVFGNPGKISTDASYFKLDGKTPVKITQKEYMILISKNDTHTIQKTIINNFSKQYCWISTIFLGVDPSCPEDEEPILFETMIFDGALDRVSRRYISWDEAMDGHQEAIDMVKDTVAKL